MPKALSFSDSAIPAILRLLVDKAPETTLAQLLADPSIGVLARGITLQQLAAALEHRTSDTTTATVPAAARTTARRRSSTPRVTASAPAPAAAEYDAAILVEITAAPEPVGSVAIRTKTGGTPEQFRAAVERLIAAKKVKKSGVAKGTRYRAA